MKPPAWQRRWTVPRRPWTKLTIGRQHLALKYCQSNDWMKNEEIGLKSVGRCHGRSVMGWIAQSASPFCVLVGFVLVFVAFRFERW